MIQFVPVTSRMVVTAGFSAVLYLGQHRLTDEKPTMQLLTIIFRVKKRGESVLL